jgi:hypothetical protein
MGDRPFRSAESHKSEERTRKMLPGFLRDRGFSVERESREHQGQTIVVTSPEGERLTMRIRLCWVRESNGRDSERKRTYSATQLLANIKNGDWIGSLQAKVHRETKRGITHLLFVQRDDADIKYAALVPLSDLVAVWTEQRDISQRLIDQGKLGRRKKNHAMNGTSPTLWLQDDKGGQEVADALWKHNGVRNLAAMQVFAVLAPEEANWATRSEILSYVPRPDDRRAVIQTQIRERRGQRSFRDSLRIRFENRCVVTGCQILDVLEAAHIRPYRGEDDNHVENGLLLRADIHTLFDLNLLGIEPEQLTVKLHSSIVNYRDYACLEGKPLECSSSCRPSVEALRSRYKEFSERQRCPPVDSI